ncbi:DHH family phosphoesterase [Croceiramulus getboli]|nr:bifunctional oligoribonuclease/PAP phosphatase NrnA [Flavobacteriaceae bacterium YJPT1-3]
MEKSELQELKSLLAEPKKVIIVPHKSPDGDAIGSTLALCQYLKKKGHEAVVIAPNNYPNFLKWMPYEKDILNYEAFAKAANQQIEAADLIFTLDFNSLSRAGAMSQVLTEASADFIMIDHHQQPDDYARITYSDTSVCATSQMVYHLIDWLGDKDLIDTDIASCLYTGIMTDTGSFRFRSTTSTTHRVIADLIDRGADGALIHQQVYDVNSYSRMQLLGVAMNNLRVLPPYRTAYITLSQEELDAHNYQKGDTEGFVNYGLSLEGVIFAVIFIENREEGIVKISFRSVGDFSVNEFARNHFEGGGHTNAAGGKSDLALQETVDKFISILPEYKNALQ